MVRGYPGNPLKEVYNSEWLHVTPAAQSPMPSMASLAWNSSSPEVLNIHLEPGFFPRKRVGTAKCDQQSPNLTGVLALSNTVT